MKKIINLDTLIMEILLDKKQIQSTARKYECEYEHVELIKGMEVNHD